MMDAKLEVITPSPIYQLKQLLNISESMTWPWWALLQMNHQGSEGSLDA